MVEPDPSEKYEFINWDDELPNIWENKIHVPNHQPVFLVFPQSCKWPNDAQCIQLMRSCVTSVDACEILHHQKDG